jgi:hypothetical protein
MLLFQSESVLYAEPVTGRSYISFADCDPAQLIIRTTPRKHWPRRIELLQHLSVVVHQVLNVVGSG